MLFCFGKDRKMKAHQIELCNDGGSDERLTVAAASAAAPHAEDTEMLQLLSEWQHYSGRQAAMHDRCRSHFRFWNFAVALPAIILSTIAGTANIGVGVTANGDEDSSGKGTIGGVNWLSVSFGTMGLVSACLFAIHRYLQLPELQREHDLFADEFAKLEAEIHMHTTLHANMLLGTENMCMFRTLGELTKHVKRSMDSLIDKAPPITSRMQAKVVGDLPLPPPRLAKI